MEPVDFPLKFGLEDYGMVEMQLYMVTRLGSQYPNGCLSKIIFFFMIFQDSGVKKIGLFLQEALLLSEKISPIFFDQILGGKIKFDPTSSLGGC